MNQNTFINEAFTIGITQYLENKENNDFLTVVIKTLINIYGELDIINPYKTNTESGMGGFDENLTKFGYTREDLSLFKQEMMDYYLTKNQIPNKYFNKIEKDLIDMFFLKIRSVNHDENTFNSFKSYLMFNNEKSIDKTEIERYFSYKLKMVNTDIKYQLVENNTLNKEAYEILGYSYENIINMSKEQLFDINNKVFDYFKIDQNSQDKYLRLDQAIMYYKEFGEKEEKKAENGYVEFLLLSGFIAISILTITVIIGVLAR